MASGSAWYFDPRLDESAQMAAPIFDDTDFAFGHVTRREDPIWGDGNVARMANDDTFYMTDCSTQHKDFNGGIWLKLENAMLAAARKGRRRITAFSGPVLLPDDPEVLEVQMPTAFWKVVAWVERDELHARGYLQSQRTLVDAIVRDVARRRFEGLPQLGVVEPFEAAIADIARTTSLDFGALVAADEKAGGLESRRGRRLTESSVDSLSRRLSGADGALETGDGDGRGRNGHGDADGDGELRRLLVDIARNQERLLDLLARR